MTDNPRQNEKTGFIKLSLQQHLIRY